MTVQAVATAKPAGKAAEAAPPQSWTIAGRKKDPEVEKLVELSYLLLEGNRHIRAMIRDALHGMAIRKISEMDSAEEALMHLEKREFDALLVGGELPAMSTIEFVWRLRRSADAKLRQTPVVMIGEDATEHAVRKAVDVGVNEYLFRPFAPSVLFDRIRRSVLTPKPFIVAEGYIGPDRRQVDVGPVDGTDRRKSSAEIAEEMKTAIGGKAAKSSMISGFSAMSEATVSPASDRKKNPALSES